MGGIVVRIILIEDDDYKANQVVRFLENKGYQVDVAKAYNSGMKKIVNRKYDVALIDMTIPSFEISKEHPTSRIRKYGGRDILVEIDRREINLPSIVITQYQVFDDGEITLELLDKELEEEFPNLYRGIVYYNSSVMDWQDKLIEKLGDDRNV